MGGLSGISGGSTTIESDLELRQDPDPTNKAGRTAVGTVESGFETFPASNKLRYVVMAGAYVWDEEYIPVLNSIAELNALTEEEDGMVIRFNAPISVDLNDGQGAVDHDYIHMKWTTEDSWIVLDRKDPIAVPTPVDNDAEQSISITAGGDVDVDYLDGNFVKLTGVAVATINFKLPTNHPTFKAVKMRVESAQGQSVTWESGFNFKGPVPVFGTAGVLLELEKYPDETIVSQVPDVDWEA
jgi:hypothetical protein